MHFKLLAAAFILILPCFSAAQEAVTYRNTVGGKALKAYKEGQAHADRGSIALAQSYFEKSVKADPMFVDAWMALGEMESAQNNWALAEAAYERALQLDDQYASVAYFRAAEAEWQQDKYAEAGSHARSYMSANPPNDSKYGLAQNLLASANFAQKAVAHPVPFEPKNLGPGVNTPAYEYFPSFTADGEMLVFTRRTTDEDFYQSTPADTTWSQAEPMMEINTRDNEGAQAISPDGTWLVFTACNRYGDGSQGSCDLYWSQLRRAGWTEPKPFSSSINSSNWESQPSIGADGVSIAFTSNRPGGFGQKDLWITRRGADRQWSEPENLGPTINTGGNENTPYLHPDGQTLYFTSDSLPGMGGEDLYMCRKQADGSWGTPVNLGYPINTKADEFALTVSLDGRTGYYASDRPGGYGKLDIYAFELPENVRPLPTTYAKIIVKDAETGERLSARADVIRLESGERQVGATTRKDGTALVCLPAGKKYLLNVNRPGYLFYSGNFDLTGQSSYEKPFIVTAELVPLPSEENPERSEKAIVLRNVFFDTGSARLKPESSTELDRLAALLEKHADLRIQLNGHTDNVGEDASNQTLSENRAKAVYDYLVNKGIDPERLKYKGFGETQPIDTNDTEEGRQNNRRTEFVLW